MSMSAAVAVTATGAVLWSGMRAAILRNGGPAQRKPVTSRCQVRRARASAFAVLLAMAGGAPAADSPWRDLESRIQYGYYTEDAAALRSVSEVLGATDAHDKLHGYYAALEAWRLALLASQGTPVPGASGSQLAQRCVSELDGALALDGDFADGLALRAACSETPLEGGGLRAPFTGHRARKDLERALQLAPRNPRVLLVDALCDYALPAARGGNKERALPKLRQAVSAFEAERSAADHLPGWGAADAWLLLARDLLDNGDLVGARDALEHALLLAPEYAQARRLMTKITAG
jgi:tetratricopeptide (TPR) repeat protein